MHGLITTRNLVVNAPTIISEFGTAAYMRCLAAALFSRRPVTFLECVMRLQSNCPQRTLPTARPD